MRLWGLTGLERSDTVAPHPFEASLRKVSMRLLQRALVGVAALVALSACAEKPEPQPRPFWGQWLWSSTDRRVFFASRREVPDLLPGVWASTLSFKDGEVVQRLALSPDIEDGARVAILIRFHESFHEAWIGTDDAKTAAAIGARLATLLGHVAATGVTVAEVHLDYDCPVRRLPRWAAIVRRLTAGPLAGREVWVTSLVAHVRAPAYGELFRGSVAGHILQLFDTGDRVDPFSVKAVGDLAARHRMPFRLGVGAYERILPGNRTTDHRRWFGAVPSISRSAWFRGVWVFPAGRAWTPLMEGTS